MVKAATHIAPFLRGKRLASTIEGMTTLLRDKEFDAIAVRGVSGLLVGPAVAANLDKNLIVVRKGGEDCHSGFGVEGLTTSKNYVIVDDLIATGTTIKRIVGAIQECIHKDTRCVGIGLFWNSPYETKTTFKIGDEDYVPIFALQREAGNEGGFLNGR